MFKLLLLLFCLSESKVCIPDSFMLNIGFTKWVMCVASLQILQDSVGAVLTVSSG